MIFFSAIEIPFDFLVYEILLNYLMYLVIVSCRLVVGDLSITGNYKWSS